MVATSSTPSVSLTGDGGDSLIGSYCPGTKQLICTVNELYFLRWKFNRNFEIYNFFSTYEETFLSREEFTSNPAFVSIELLSVSHEGITGNFSSILTVDTVHLQKQNITDISCDGSATTGVSLPVDVSIYTESPSSLAVTNVTSHISSSMVQYIRISWKSMVDL